MEMTEEVQQRAEHLLDLLAGGYEITTMREDLSGETNIVGQSSGCMADDTDVAALRALLKLDLISVAHEKHWYVVTRK